MVSGGLDWRLAIVAIACGQLIVSQAIIFNGTIGVSSTPTPSRLRSAPPAETDMFSSQARLHIPFPVIVRASFGFCEPSPLRLSEDRQSLTRPHLQIGHVRLTVVAWGTKWKTNALRP